MSALGIVAGALETLTELPQLFLTLGGVVFYDQEIPSSLQGGGEQMLSVHKYPGGVRTVDALGADDRELEWEGNFLDLFAEQRCHQIDAMRRKGLDQVLTWSSYRYLVVIRGFNWTYERPWQIRYQLSLMVVQDLLFPPNATTPSSQETVTADQTAATNNASSMTATNYAGAH